MSVGKIAVQQVSGRIGT